MKKSNLKIIITVLFVLALLVPGQVSAMNSEQAKTEPPLEVEVSLFTVFDSNFSYLDRGSGYISYLGNGKVTIGGETVGTRRVATIGVQLTLQRWTGTDWIDVNTGANVAFSDSSYVYSSREATITEGYYYRVKSRHWISYGDIKEEGTRYTSSLLIN
ncbi:hypothetical protein ACP8HI_01795 [Paenibacillus sp. FA6]|uniref:hypothetical protein n=1 Tax=Paenibacillus sp. FA6 TaxID=3413029 RepID=UPI003F65CAAE